MSNLSIFSPQQVIETTWSSTANLHQKGALLYKLVLTIFVFELVVTFTFDLKI